MRVIINKKALQMKILKYIVLIFTIILISCSSNKKLNAISNKAYQKDVNYIPYYLKVYEAKELYESKEYEKSYNLLDSLFRYYQPIETPTVYEMDIYCELSKKLKKYNNEILKSILKTETVKYAYHNASPLICFSKYNYNI